MIYVSSSCVKAAFISESVKILAREGFSNIELSGGTKHYPELEKELLELKEEFGLNYLCHNYFPPPTEAFVLNLASLDKKVAQMSLDHCKRAIELSISLGAEQFAFHAGFLINIPLDQIGKKIKKRELFNREDALHLFHENLQELNSFSGDKVRLYIENNVLSSANFMEFDQTDPFFFTNSANLSEALGNTATGYLLDLAHLRVSCHSLGLNYDEELDHLFDGTDYIHLSGNDGKADLNWALTKESEIYQSLQNRELKGKTITLETYADLKEIRSSYELIENLL